MEYAYFVGTILFFIVWLIFYLSRRDLRKEILVTSIVLGFIGLCFEYFWYIHDWVHPTTITKTPIGIEDFILAFSAGGIATASYKIFFHRSVFRSSKFHNNWLVIIPFFLLILATDVLFRYFGIFSFYANSIGFAIALLIMLVIRKDLIKEAIFSGIILTTISIPLYWLLFLFYPDFIPFYWNMDNVSGILFLGIPYEDLVWWLIASSVVGIAYDFCLGLRTRKS